MKKLLNTPFEKFLKAESLSGILIFIATIVALIWANSGIKDLYESLWQYELGIKAHNFQISKSLFLWINDGLMAVFFFIIGLEIKRELLIGELNTRKKAALPVFAAIGGMIVPISVFLILNDHPETRNGWAIPMATDIAFSIAILQFAGRRVPLSLKVFLLAFAIADDLGSVLIIGIFYSSQINLLLLLYASLLILILFYLSYKGIYIKYLTIIFAVIIWFLFLKAGIHPTIAGVILAFTIPVRQKTDIRSFTSKLCEISMNFEKSSDSNRHILTKDQIVQMDELEDWTERVQSPLQHLEHRLHKWVAFIIMPVFALSNAGIALSSTYNMDKDLMISIAAALIFGKCIGIFGMVFISIKTGMAEMPAGSNYMQVLGIAFLAGVGFTMSIFIANLAFAENSVYIASAKSGILIGSFISGIIGYVLIITGGSKKTQ